MLKKENRLTTNFEFNITRKHGEKMSTRLFHLYYLKPKNYTGPPKIGIVVSTKFHKVAVKRNRVKRVFSEAVRTNLEKFKEDFWYVIHPSKKSLEVKYEEINSEFNKTISKISSAN